MTAPIDNPSTEQPPNTDPAGDPSAEQPPGTEPDSDKDGAEDELPEWARKKLTRTNAEAANYRTRLREAEAQLAEAKTTEEFETALADMREKNAALEAEIQRGNAARKYGLPDDLAARLQGSTPEELDADAKALAKYAASTTAPPERLSGGLDPTDSDDVFDPVAEARRARASRR